MPKVPVEERNGYDEKRSKEPGTEDKLNNCQKTFLRSEDHGNQVRIRNTFIQCE